MELIFHDYSVMDVSEFDSMVWMFEGGVFLVFDETVGDFDH